LWGSSKKSLLLYILSLSPKLGKGNCGYPGFLKVPQIGAPPLIYLSLKTTEIFSLPGWEQVEGCALPGPGFKDFRKN
jgi:hypothetical protein